MVARQATPFRSANAGEFSQDAMGRIDIKQYYSAGIAYKNIEPVPQSGFRQMGGSWRMGVRRRPMLDRPITGPAVTGGALSGTQTIWTGAVAGSVAAVLFSGLAISAGTATIEAQALISGVWTKIAGPFAVATGTPITRLAAFAPGQQQVATGLRLRATFSVAATVTIAGVTASYESGTALSPRFQDLTTDAGDAILAVITEGMADFYTEDGYEGSASLPAVTAAMLPDLDFYAEASTIGLFHGTLQTARLLLMTPGQLADWRADLWPYDPPPSADLGGAYPKVDDVWEVAIRWSSNSAQMYLNLTVDAEPTSGIPILSGGVPVAVDLASGSDWTTFAADVQAALVALPNLGAGVTVVAANVGGSNNYKLTITFGGALSGAEYDLSAVVSNSADVSALPYHTQIGKTDFEDLFSITQGWPGTVGLVQDRLGYGRIPAVTGALSLSRVAEYFDLDAKAVTDDAARLDKIRSQTTEIIVWIKESKYLLVGSDRGVYFADNRTIDRNTPLNFVLASETGAQPNCKPFDLEGEVYYVSINPKGMPERAGGGKQLLSIIYDDVSTSYNAAPVSLLASHLVDQVVRSARQRPETDLDAAKGWLLRADGRLIAAQIIKNQEITGFCEWIAASGGLVREIRIDGRNRLWLDVERAGTGTIELYDNAIFLQDSVTVTPDLAGLVTGLAAWEGAEVYAVADGFVLGPFTVAGGSVDLKDSFDEAIVGRWQPPRWESMPQVYVTPGDDVVLRPGRIHTAFLNLVGTTSIAVGANGEAARDVPLLEAGDLADAPMPAKTKLLTVAGMTGFVTGTTMVVTQARPGQLRVRDLAMGSKL